MTTRSTLTRIPKSTLAIMFNDRWEDKLSRDKYGNIFLDFNPILFQHLLEQLRLVDNEELITLYPHSVIVDQMRTMYIVDFGNDRILRWFNNHFQKSVEHNSHKIPFKTKGICNQSGIHLPTEIDGKIKLITVILSDQN